MMAGRRRFLSACIGGASVVQIGGTVQTAQTAPAGGWPSSFPQLRQAIHGFPLAYLDSAATTLKPQSVIDALVRYYSSDNANPSPVHTVASRAAERLSTARQALARFANASDPSEIVFVRGTTEGLNLVASTWGAANLRPGDEVILTVAEHSSNLMPWIRAARDRRAAIRLVDVDDEGRLRLDEFARLLSRRTKVVAFTHVSNVLGFVNPVKEICALARKVGACVVIDGAQGAPHVTVDVQDLGCDFYIFSGHKMLGPMGTGVVWGRRELLDAMPPFHVGSNMAHNVEVDRADVEHGAQKFQAGTPDVAGPTGLATAVQWLEAAGRDALWRHDQDLAQHGLDRLASVPGLRLIGPHTPEQRVPVFTFVMSGRSAPAVARALDRRGIAIRAGDMAALPLLKRFGTTEAARASAYVYSTRDDLDRLAGALGEVAKSGGK